MTGVLRISDTSRREGITLDVHYITDIDLSVSKRVMVTPIVSNGMDSAFPLENGSNMSISFKFSRKNPDQIDDESNDQKQWSNAKWYEMLTGLMNRWQLRSNGYLFQYNETDGEGDFSPSIVSIRERGYIKRLSRRYTSSHNTLITGTIDVSVGTAYISTKKTNQVEIFPFELRPVLKPGALGNLYLMEDGLETAISAGTLFKNILNEDVQMSIPTSYRSMSVVESFTIYIALPDLPTSWSTISEWCGGKFEGWKNSENSEQIYLPGQLAPMTFSIINKVPTLTSSGEFIAQWEAPKQ